MDPSVEVMTGAGRFVVNGLLIQKAIKVAELYGVLGRPTRVDSGVKPAPPGHRNNQVHVYDSRGLFFIEHHVTGLVSEMTCTFEQGEGTYRFTPTQPYRGKLVLDGVEMPLGGRLAEFLAASPVRFEPVVAGRWKYRVGGGFYIGLAGARERRGSRHYKLLEVSVSWPEDE